MTIGITIGDINGIGLEVALKALDFMRVPSGVHFALIGNTAAIAEYVEALQLPYTLERQMLTHQHHGLQMPVLHCPTKPELQFGAINPDAGKAAMEALEYSVNLLKSKQIQAVVTQPVTKSNLYSNGFSMPGQTEFYADAFSVEDPMMVLFTGKLKVGLVTAHIPLHQVSAAISQEIVFKKISQLIFSLRNDFGMGFPRVAVLGLNPHAGEDGALGTEENDVIVPAIADARVKRTSCVIDGPFPADAFFAHGLYQNYNGVVAMYHDQGLIPLKMLAKGGGVNFTTMLPIVRTSPDHGTALDIAGANIANPQSTVEAILSAIHIVKQREKQAERMAQMRSH